VQPLIAASAALLLRSDELCAGSLLMGPIGAQMTLMSRVSALCDDAELFQQDGAWKVEADTLPTQRYDRMFEAMDCHVENVRRLEHFRPALGRALGAGKTAMINVIGDRRVGHSSLGGSLLGSTRVTRPF
jgi:hypothetical protein